MILPGIATLLKILSIITSSWLLIHLLAIFGVFLAFAYPLWWFFAPSKTICLNCQARGESGYCGFCRQKIEKTKLHPKNLRSVVLNSLLIFTFSLFSLGLIYIESKLLDLMGFPPSEKTVSFVIPNTGKYRIGETFPMSINLQGMKSPVNTIQADVSFDPTRLEIVDISTDSSFANVFIQKEINNTVGFGRLTGGLPNPGFQLEEGLFGTVFFRGRRAGMAEVKFLPSTLVLANDGKGSNILKDLPKATYLILPEHVYEYESKQQATKVTPNVLGEMTEKTSQLILYSEGGVLGTKTEIGDLASETPPKELPKPNILERMLSLFEKVDQFTLSFWGKLSGT